MLLALGSSVAQAEKGSTADSSSMLGENEFQGFEGFDLVNLTERDFFDTEVNVATAGIGKTSLRETPSVVEVISAEDIAMWGYRSVDEVLRHVVGFYSSDDHTIGNLGVRGINGGLGAEGSIVKVMIDGHSMNFRPTSGAHVGVELIPISAVERIEIIRGPASAVYGADAFLAVVNVVTHSPASEGYSADLAARGGYIGDNGAVSGDFIASAKHGAWSLLVSGTLDNADRSGLELPESSPAPVRPAYNADATTGEGLQRDDRSLYSKVAYANDSGTVRAAHIGFRNSDFSRGGDFARWGQLTTSEMDRGTVIALQQYNIVAGGVLQFPSELAATWRLQHAWGGSGDDERIEVGTDLFYVRRNWGFRSTDGAVTADWRSSRRFGLTAGAEFVSDKEDIANSQRVSLTDQDLESSELRPEQTLSNIGLLLQSHYHALKDEKLKFTGGVRLDRHSTYGSQITGRLAAVMSWNDKLVTKALYGSAFKAPAPFLLFSRPLQPGDVIGNPELAPQKVHSFELHSVYRLQKYLNLSIGGTYSLVLDKAEFIAEGINQTAQNVATANVLTGEAKLDIRWNKLLRGYLAAEYHRHERDLGQPGFRASLVGTRNGVYPSFIARAGGSTSRALSSSVTGRLGVQARYIGMRTSSDANSLENISPYELPAYVDADAVISAQWQGPNDLTSRISLRATNATNVKSADPGFAGVDLPVTARQVYLEWRQSL